MIAFDNAANSFAGFATTINLSFTAAANSYMYVGTSRNVSSISYNSVALTKFHTYTPVFPSGTNNTEINVWRLHNPASGANTLSYTTSNAATVLVGTWTGLNQTTQTESVTDQDSANNQVATWPMSATAMNSNEWAIGFAIGSDQGGARKIVADTGSTLRATDFGNLGTFHMSLFDSNGTIPAGAYGLNIIVNNTSNNQSADFITSAAFTVQPPFQSAGSFLQYYY